jgi:hypothetical protein
MLDWSSAVLSIVTALAAFIGVMTALLVSVAKLQASLDQLAERLTRADKITDSRVDTVWRSLTNRGTLRAKNEGYIIGEDTGMAATVRSDIKSAFDPVRPVLAKIYRETVKEPGDEGKFTEALEKQMSAWLMKHICGPLGVHEYECAAMALLVAKEEACL